MNGVSSKSALDPGPIGLGLSVHKMGFCAYGFWIDNEAEPKGFRFFDLRGLYLWVFDL